MRILLTIASIFWGFLSTAQNAPPNAVPVAGFLDSPFVITQIYVDIGANDEQTAKDLAIDIAKKAAYNRLVSRMVINPKPEDTPNIQELYSFIDKLVINQEKTLNRIDDKQPYKFRYHAQMVVHFNPIKVQQYWVKHTMQYALTPSPPMLIVPYYDDGTPVVWNPTRPNPLHDAIRLALPRDGLIRFVLPEAEDRRKDVISEMAVEHIDEKALAQLMNIYATPYILIIGAVGGSLGNQEFIQFEAQILGNEWLTRHYQFRMIKAVGQGVEELLNPAVQRILNEVEADYQKLAMQPPENNKKYTYRIDINFKNLPEWVDILGKLTRLQAVSTHKIVKIEPYKGTVDIVYFGDDNRLINDLQLAGFMVKRDEKNKLIINNKP